MNNGLINKLKEWINTSKRIQIWIQIDKYEPQTSP